MPILHKPYYVIDFKASACKFILLVNDVPAFSYDDTGSVNSQVPINHLILHSGRQHVSYIMLPMQGQHMLTKHSSLEIKICVASADDDGSNTVDVADYKPVAVPDAGLPQLIQQYEFEAEVPYNLTGWSPAVNLKNDPGIKADLIKTYRKIEGMLRSKDYASVRAIFNQKLGEIDTAIYSNPAETDSDWGDMVAYISQPGMEIVFNPDASQLHFYGDGKIVTLLKPNHEPALYFEDRAKKEEYQLPLLFYKKAPGAALTIIR